MGSEASRLTTVVQVLAGEVDLAEPLGFPEFSAFAATKRQWQTALSANAKAIREDRGLSPILWLHRRRLSVEPQVGTPEPGLDADALLHITVVNSLPSKEQ